LVVMAIPRGLPGILNHRSPPERGARTDNPLPPRPHRRPRGKGPRQAPYGSAQKRGEMVGGRRRSARSAELAVSEEL
jgi:hypothetical protein